MVLVKLLGLLDILAGAMVIAEGRFDLPTRVVLAGAGYLVIKGILFWRSITSWVDAAIGLLLLVLTIITLPLISMIAGIYLIIKGIISLI